MPNSQTLNPSENQNKLLTKSSNFLNSQNYILGKSEKKKVLSSFLGTEILKIFLNYLMYILSLFIILFSIVLVYFYNVYFLVSTIFIIVGVISFKSNKIENIEDYLILKNETVVNTLLKSFLIPFFLFYPFYFISLFLYENNYMKYFYLIVIFFGIFLLILWYYYDKHFKFSKYNQLNILNILLLPFVLIVLLFTYSLIYIFFRFKSYIVLKNNPFRYNFLGFINYTSLNYQIIKK